ncbi:hypothetical protein, partial [Mycobacterium marinum]|uniref:hypothetical protein n=1 Tax=Mycobacterium marinum TaxID=1781 RepID=UPI00402A14B9
MTPLPAGAAGRPVSTRATVEGTGSARDAISAAAAGTTDPTNTGSPCEVATAAGGAGSAGSSADTARTTLAPDDEALHAVAAAPA